MTHLWPGSPAPETEKSYDVQSKTFTEDNRRITEWKGLVSDEWSF